jgi:hypothetical protein
MDGDIWYRGEVGLTVIKLTSYSYGVSNQTRYGKLAVLVVFSTSVHWDHPMRGLG